MLWRLLDSKVNDTPSSRVQLGSDYLWYLGPLTKLKSHQAGTLCALVGLEAPFQLRWQGSWHSTRAALIGVGVRHELDFAGRQVLAFYFDPHHPLASSLRHNCSQTCLLREQLSSHLIESTLENPTQPIIDSWLSFFERIWITEKFATNPKFSKLLKLFNSDQALNYLDMDLESLAKLVELSTSRLTHLIKEQSQVGIRKLKQYYRFKLAALSLVSGGDYTLAAHAGGFSDSAHFSKAFRDTFGLSPSQILNISRQYANPMAPATQFAIKNF